MLNNAILAFYPSDTIQVAKKMTKDSRGNSHYEQSFQQSNQDPTKYQTRASLEEELGIDQNINGSFF